jgi:hypothetical protein
MPHLFELLFLDYTGQLLVANLHTAEREQVLRSNIIQRFARHFRADAPQGTKRARAIAEDIVFAQPGAFQLAGPEVRPPRKNLINIRPLSQVHFMLTAGESRPSDPEHMLREVRAIVAARPENIYGRENRLLWIAEQDDEIQVDLDWLLSRDIDRSTEGAAKLKRIMLYYGLPIYSGTVYLITEFSSTSWGSQPHDLTYRRPSAFDGVDNDYFKQRRLRPCVEETEWNKTVDLGTALHSDAALNDGAWEAVGMPLQMARITKTASVLSSIDARPVDPRVFVDCIKHVFEQAGTKWDQIPADMISTVIRGAVDGAPP